MRRLSLLLCVLLLTGCMVQQGLIAKNRPKNWAQPVVKQGLPNFHQVSPSLFRSAQPLAQGLMNANQERYFKTIVSLRAGYPDAAIVPPTNVNYVQIEFNTWDVKDEHVIEFLKIATNPSNQPVLLHCQHGADRTGMMSAIYRIVVEGWSKTDAIAEMRQGGFGYHPVWFNLIRYINNLDVQELRKQLPTYS